LGGSAGVVKLLLDHGAEIDARDRESGATPLFYAASWGRAEVVDLLLARGADCTLKNTRGQTPLEAAQENSQKEAADLINARVVLE
jgi:ankyrin repeat protein